VRNSSSISLLGPWTPPASGWERAGAHRGFGSERCYSDWGGRIEDFAGCPLRPLAGAASL